ncbi:monocarboxylate transporter 12 [Diachasma alloeum]|uniref:monocarboxylate transporter 12 n=1 Tax=Diachasma alloeum TaxID=454923 RepID=UPI00073835DC|nr:monocarboxylate transporter 12 [Diachasma alloeum]XP_015114145.1 monocarboxylate transporter 12 [Diachasma alloeum]XP_015114146.1 monocarboxylate transporter 12 [Diachasma alloeum]XP_015114147.1 monocarboxylate transporter 12 [Diachasma alloeum]XP_015114148.1 monocarboxylate transporter 12 [Diachasma alloeum]XP_015114149.1 monocarboxylate transporter 12 [Diachasma alloeum]
MAHALEDTEKKQKGKESPEGTVDLYEPAPPPDGGWGWAVVFASFMIHIVTDGVTYSFGVFHVELRNYFQAGDGATAWIASILVGITLCSGPISSIFVNKYGCRLVTIVGAILASICLLISYFAQNIIILYFTIGLGTGLGFGLVYLPAIVSVTCYFEKLRSLATGIAVCGSGLGTLVFAPFIEYLIGEFGWRGAMLIASALVLNCIIFGIMFRPLEPVRKIMDIPMMELTKPEEPATLKVPQTNGLSANGFARPHSVTNVNHTKYHLVPGNEETNLMRIALSQPVLISKTGHVHRSRDFGSGLMHRKDILYQRSIENIRKRSASLGCRDLHVALRGSLSSLPNGIDEKQGQNNNSKHTKPLSAFQQMLQLSLLKDSVFLLFVFSNFCTSIGFNVPYVYIIGLAEGVQISRESASYLLSVIGIANTVGRIVLGYVSDKSWINRLVVYNICLTICGVATVLGAFCPSYTWFVIYASVYGFTAGAYVGLTSVILVDLLGLDLLTNAFGLLLLFQGFASLLGPPIAGWLKDGLGSYQPGFVGAGVMIAVSGLILFLIPVLQRKVRRKEERTSGLAVQS